MASTTFISRVTKIAREWLQDVNDCTYGPTAPTTTLRGQLASTASASDGDALLAVLSPITGAVARTQHQKNQDYISAEDIGAVGDGVTSDRTAFSNALAGGKFINLVPGKTYYLGQVTSASAVFTISGVDGCGIRFNGAKIVVQTSGGNYNAPLFSLNNLNGFTLEDPWIEDTGFDQSVTWKGISVVRLHPTSGEVRNVVMRGCQFKGVVAALDADDATNRAYGLWFDGDVENCYYGVNLANNGDVAFLNYRAKNAVRSYFCYGIKSHIFNIVSVGHAAAGNADCLIKCKDAAFPTRDIKGRFISVGSLATTNPQLVFESQNDSGDAAITDVHVEYNDRQSTGLATSIAFRHFSDAGVLQASDPNTKTNIRVTGYAGAAVSTLSTPTSPQRWLLDDVRPYTVGFRAYLSSTVTNVTGNGATYKPIMTGEEYDTGNDYNTSTGDFTAPWDGYYTFSFSALITDLSTAATLFDLTLVTTSKTYTNQYGLNLSASALQQAASATFSRIFMSAGQTASVRVRVAGMAGDTADLFGDGTIGYTTFSGYQERT